VQRDTSLELDLGKPKKQEDRWIWWNTYADITKWFDGANYIVLELEFDRLPNEGEECEGEIMLDGFNQHRIVNSYETSVSVDGASGSTGGRPYFTFFDPSNPNPGSQQNKAYKSCTVIFASIAANEMPTPHFQLCTKSKTDDGLLRWSMSSFKHFHNIIAQAGFKKDTELHVNFGKIYNELHCSMLSRREGYLWIKSAVKYGYGCCKG
jgi:hypothetical protein